MRSNDRRGFVEVMQRWVGQMSKMLIFSWLSALSLILIVLIGSNLGGLCGKPISPNVQPFCPMLF
jgi:hypothetical protein